MAGHSPNRGLRAVPGRQERQQRHRHRRSVVLQSVGLSPLLLELSFTLIRW